MVCPSCNTQFYYSEDDSNVHYIPYNSKPDLMAVEPSQCPDCGQFIIYADVPNFIRVYPHTDQYEGLPFVPDVLRSDYVEARKVIKISPNASAMLARRCLQRLLREHMGIKGKTLADEIRSASERNLLPEFLREDLDSVRLVGNFGAHPEKSIETGTIVDVEPGEAEWSLQVVEAMFDLLFVGPEKSKQRRHALNAKLEQAGRPKLASGSLIPFPKRA